MGAVSISYSALNNAITQARNSKRTLEDYANTLTSRIVNAGGNLPGSDECGHISDAGSKAWNKITELNCKAGQMEQYGNTLSRFVETVKECDRQIVRDMDRLTEEVAKSRNIFEVVGDFIFNTFMVDIPNQNSITRFLMDCRKTANDLIGNAIEGIKNWFKYGAGKYIWNIVDGIICVAAAAVTAVTAILAIGTGFGLVIAIAASVSFMITAVNVSKKIDANAKALQLDQNSPGAARFYGKIDGMSDYVDKTDLGNQFQNDAAKFGADVMDGIKTAADVVAIAGGIAEIGGVKNTDGVIYKYDFSNANKETIIKNIKDKFKVDKIFEPEKYNKKYITNALAENRMTTTQIDRVIKGFSGIKTAKKVDEFINKGISVYDSFKDGTFFSTDTVKDGIGILGNILPAVGILDEIISVREKLYIPVKVPSVFNSFYVIDRVDFSR